MYAHNLTNELLKLKVRKKHNRIVTIPYSWTKVIKFIPYAANYQNFTANHAVYSYILENVEGKFIMEINNHIVDFPDDSGYHAFSIYIEDDAEALMLSLQPSIIER